MNFLLRAQSRKVTIDGSEAGSLAAGPNHTRDQILLAASARLKPGPHTVKLSATGETGEQRETTLAVVIDALPTVPNNATRPPVVLLNGWEEGFTGTCPIATSSATTFGNLSQYLVADGVPVVYLFDNCAEDANQTIEQLGNDLGTFLNAIHYANGTQVPQIDLVAHSMGGLIARSYLAGLQPSSGLVLNPPATTLVRKLVLIATPNFGSFVAATFAQVLAPGSQSAEMIPGSSFLWNLGTWNQFGDDLRGVDAIAVAGNAGAYNATLANGGDGLVSLTSASLGFVAQQSSVTRIVPYCHVDPSAFYNTILGAFNCFGVGIANVTDTNHLTGQIVRSFLGGTTTWKSIGGSPAQDPYLSVDGGVFFGLLNSAGNYVSDITQVQWGSVVLSAGGDSGTIFWDDMANGTAQYVVSSTSLGGITCPSSKQPVGFFAVTRCKYNVTITSVSPEASVPGKVVAAGAALTLNGVGFGTSQCGSCKVTATPASGSSGAQTLTVTSWSSTAITVNLPASLTGLLALTVSTATSADNVNVMAAAGTPGIAPAPTSLQFSYAVGGAAPDAQTVSITNSGTGTLNWTATPSDSWLAVTPSSGTAPSSLSVSIVTNGLSAGSYSGNIQLSASGVSNVSVPVALTVTQGTATLAVAPKSLNFQYLPGGNAPSAQSVTITNAGSGTLAWTATDSDSWVGLSPANGNAPGTLAVSINPANLAAGSYSSTIQITAAGAAGSPATVAVTLVVQAAQGPGTIAAVLNAAGDQPGFASATWVSVFGTNLAPTTDSWQAGSFVNGALPTSLDGVSVTINGQPAYVSFISPGQINVLAPDDPATGAVQVQVTSGQQQSNSFSTQKSQVAPAFFEFGVGPYVAALHADYTAVGNPNLLPGVVSTPAAPGEVIQIYATGFGATNPPLPTGQLVTTPSPLAGDAQVTIGGVSAAVQFAGLVGPGLYQLNVVVPQLAGGDAPVVATVGGAQTQAGAMITVGQ